MAYVSECKEVAESSAVTMSLRLSAVTPSAKNVIAALAAKVRPGKPALPNHARVCAAIVGDLLRGAAFTPRRPCFRPMGKASFSGGAVGYGPFRTVLRALEGEDYVTVYEGEIDPATMRGTVTRLMPTGKLLNELGSAGISPANMGEHFKDECDLPILAAPIRLKAGSRYNSAWEKIAGKKIPVDFSISRVAELATEVHSINEFLRSQTFGGMAFDGLFRGFNQGDDPSFDWNKGGRLYAQGGSYQSMPRTERPSILINGERVVEVDIRASHLTIVHALAKTPLPSGEDPYSIPGIDRAIVKCFVTVALGSGKLPVRWPPHAALEYEAEFFKSPAKGKSGSIGKDYPISAIRSAVTAHIPLLLKLESLDKTWADFQFLESKALISAINNLKDGNIPSLPLHDSLIVPKSYSNEAELSLKEAFFKEFGIDINTKIK